MKRICVLYNQPILPLNHPDHDSELSVVRNAKIIAKILRKDFRVVEFGFTDLHDLRDLENKQVDCVLNLYDGQAGYPETEYYVPAMLEWMGIPYTGSSCACLSLARNKLHAKQILAANGIDIPKFSLAKSATVLFDDFPVIVKPVNRSGSVGIDQTSVCENAEQLTSRMKFISDNYGEAIIEEYIDGDERTIAVTKLPHLDVLPPCEVVFGDLKGWPILTFDAKWSKDSEEYKESSAYPSRSLLYSSEMKDIAKDVFSLFGCRHYARIDVRVRGNSIYVIDVNPNPEIGAGSELIQSAAFCGISHRAFLVNLINQAMSVSSP